MKALFWKEWRENWLIIVLACALQLVFMVGDLTYAVAMRNPDVTSGELQSLVVFVWFLSALLCGSSMVSPEIGLGSLQFLGVLPITRSRIWLIKLATALLVLIACIAASWATMRLFCAVVRPAGADGFTIQDALTACAVSAPLLALGSFMSTLFDRTIGALMASIVAAVAIGSAIGEVQLLIERLFQLQNHYYYAALDSQLALSVPALLCMSYVLFTRGETLRTTKRFRILAGFLLPPAAIGIACVIAWVIVMV